MRTATAMTARAGRARAGLARAALAIGAVLAVTTAAAPAHAQRPDPAYELPGLVGPENPPPPAGFDLRTDPKPDPKVKRAQTILTGFGIPVGTVDGHFGPETARGLCAFRRIAGIGTTRNALDQKTLEALKAYALKYPTLRDIPAKNYLGKSTYLVAHQTCQVVFYVEGNH